MAVFESNVMSGDERGSKVRLPTRFVVSLVVWN
jgi:hypothetical protein